MISNEISYNSKIEGELVVTKADAVINWIRKHSVWPMPMGLACCAIELMASAASRYDISGLAWKSCVFLRVNRTA